MTQTLVPGLACYQNASIIKLRELPIAGEILVNVGDQVKSDTIVGRASLPGDLHILRIAEKLGLEPFEVLNSLQKLNLKVGQNIEQGQLLCEHSGLFGLVKSRFNSPVAGTVEIISEKLGHIAIREPARQITLNAYISGQVIEVSANKSVKVEMQGAFVQGIFGIGGEKQGKIKILEIGLDQILKQNDIPKDCTGAILVGGTCPSFEVLQAAQQAGAVCFVTGSIDDQALKQYLGYDLGVAITGDEQISMSLIITEGFGELAMSKRIYDLLKEFNNAPASVNGATQVRAGAIRPEILISQMQTDQKQTNFKKSLAVGAKIRIIRVPYFGQYAEIVEMPNHLEQIASGSSARILRAKLNDGNVVTVPRANVEIV